MHISLDSKKRYDCASICPRIVPGVINMMSCRVKQRRDQEKKIDNYMPECSRRLQVH